MFPLSRRRRNPALFKYAPGDTLMNELFTGDNTRTYFDANGVLQTAGTNVKRDAHYIAGIRYLLLEGSRTNVCLWNRDLTNAAWVKSTMTAAKDQIGLDGAANSASSILATGANATVLQTVTLASSQRQQSAYIKRLIGTGAIQMTTDNGATWTAVTATAGYTRVTIPPQTLANPVFGFRLVTSGDKIAVDYVDNENGAFPSSPIATTTLAVTRAAELYKVPFAALPQAETMYADFLNLGVLTASVNQTVASISNSGAAPYFMIYNGNSSANAFSVFHNGVSAVFRSILVAALNDRAEVNATLNADGSVFESGSLNAGTEIFAGGGSGVPSAPLAVPAAWGEQFLYIGGVTGQTAYMALRSLKVLKGARTMNDMRAA